MGLSSLLVEAILLPAQRHLGHSGCSVSEPMTVLRPELLQGYGVALAGGVREGVASWLAELGARVERLDVPTRAGDEEVGRWACHRQPLRALVYDARTSFGCGGRDALIET